MRLEKRVSALEGGSAADEFEHLSDEELEARLFALLLTWREKFGLLQGWQWDARFARGKLTRDERRQALAESKPLLGSLEADH